MNRPRILKILYILYILLNFLKFLTIYINIYRKYTTLTNERCKYMKSILIKVATRFIPSLLVGLILISVSADFRAETSDVGRTDTGRPNRSSANHNAAGTGEAATGEAGADETRTASRPNYFIATDGTGTNRANYFNATGGTNETTTNRVSSNSFVPHGQFVNPLTGMPTVNDVSRNRPVAISVSNQRGALPTNATNGISQADIIYEMLVEGGITRFVALYQDFSNVGVVGSIRSARHYIVEIAEAYDALFLHAGGSPLAFEEIENREITSFDEVRGIRNQVFTRDVNRIPGHTVLQYHGAITSGARFMQWLPSYDVRTTHHNNFSQALRFTNNPIPNGARAHEVGIEFSAVKDSLFIYEESQNLYYMAQFDSFFTDANNNAPVTFSNILILEVPVTDLVGHGEGAGRQDMNTVGSGRGYLISGGSYVRINWFRADKTAQFVYTLENGSVVDFGHGKTYIGLVPPGANLHIG